MKHILLPASLLIFLFGCKGPGEEKTAVAKAPAQYSIQQLYKTKNIGGAQFNKDDSKIIVQNNETGIYNVYEITLADTAMKMLTQSAKESFFVDDYVPGSDKFIYNADKGGNENDHLYLRKTDGSVKDLTPSEKEKASFIGWNQPKTAFYYTSNKRNPQFFDFYVMDTSNWAGKMIYKNDNGMDFSGISHNERYMLFTKAVTTDKNEMYFFDGKTKKMTKLSVDSLEATYNPMGFDLNDSSFYYTTNEGKEFTYLVKYNIGTGQKDKIYETNWDVAYMQLSENGKYRVIGINEDGRNKVLLFDHATGKALDFPSVTGGDVQGVTISPSEKNMILSVASDKSPNNLWLYNFDSKQLKQLTRTLSAEVNPDDLVSAEVVRFKSFDGLEVPAIYYKPITASKDKKVPALVWVHGGPGGQSRAGYAQSVQYFVNHGYAILMVNNRGSSGYGKTFYKMDNRNHGEKDLMDVVYGKRWLAQQDYIKKKKIGICGFVRCCQLAAHTEKHSTVLGKFQKSVVR